MRFATVNISKMIQRKTLVLLTVPALLWMSCKKESTSASPNEEEICVQSVTASSNSLTEGRYIVAFDPSMVNARGMNERGIELTGETILSRNHIATASMKGQFVGEPGGFIAELTPQQVLALRDDPSVSAVEEDRVVSLATCFTVVAPRLVTWNIHRVGYGDGTGKTAWVIDTGIDFEHPDLNVDVARSKSFLPDNTSADDQNGHGTHVAGVIGAKNNNFGTLGVASGANLVSLRVLDGNGTGLLSYIIQALGYLNQNASPGDVVNMSLGDDEGISVTLDMQVQATANRGILIAIAAGNDREVANKYSPGRANGPNIYTVSAIDSADNFASFSNYGNDVVDFAAPGVRILSSFHENRYAYMSGTSMAAPHVAGLLLLRGRNINSSGTAKNDPDGTADRIAHY
jgi:subtilisin family serine protease